VLFVGVGLRVICRGRVTCSSKGTINYPTQLHLVGNFCKNPIMMHESMNVKSSWDIEFNFSAVFSLKEIHRRVFFSTYWPLDLSINSPYFVEPGLRFPF